MCHLIDNSNLLLAERRDHCSTRATHEKVSPRTITEFIHFHEHVCVCTCSDMKATLRAGWNESLEEVPEIVVTILERDFTHTHTHMHMHTLTHSHTQASERRSLKTKTEEIRKELRLANKAVIEVILDSTLTISSLLYSTIHNMGIYVVHVCVCATC